MNLLVACADGELLARFVIHNHVRTRPELRESFDAHLRGFEVFRSLDEMKAPIVTCLEDRKRPLHPAYSRGLPGTVEGYYIIEFLILSSSSLARS
jgi:hypothetical protein